MYEELEHIWQSLGIVRAGRLFLLALSDESDLDIADVAVGLQLREHRARVRSLVRIRRGMVRLAPEVIDALADIRPRHAPPPKRAAHWHTQEESIAWAGTNVPAVSIGMVQSFVSPITVPTGDRTVSSRTRTNGWRLRAFGFRDGRGSTLAGAVPMGPSGPARPRRAT